ncbi:hypothetical protein K493DRAFT_311035 [Basidiobolus meristosporus CBS 931.73]|uniref:REJ domain-containing protein n=1 Tax=Basidiobolus meristosporus CBS 931.73 TaxID=1314790 RepID=A0A1Y1Z519_9FUNG|nr:hypothetical protein K493DRAFT_311035 [Basidiobolus meristosporus CBS 931.73]|eukprot:ORY05361.1 hypothetical protein K493DRAFT_311035 [Basidiobolus meristosporus CBS 931.73]
MKMNYRRLVLSILFIVALAASISQAQTVDDPTSDDLPSSSAISGSPHSVPTETRGPSSSGNPKSPVRSSGVAAIPSSSVGSSIHSTRISSGAGSAALPSSSISSRPAAASTGVSPATGSSASPMSSPGSGVASRPGPTATPSTGDRLHTGAGILATVMLAFATAQTWF